MSVAAKNTSKSDDERHPVAMLTTKDGKLYPLDLERLLIAEGLNMAKKDGSRQITLGFILDGCRISLAKPGGPKKLPPVPPAPITNGFIAFATQPGTSANAGRTRKHRSVYTARLIQHIKNKQDINALFRQVCRDVAKDTEQAQLPWYHESIQEEKYSLWPPGFTATPVTPLSSDEQSDDESAPKTKATRIKRARPSSAAPSAASSSAASSSAAAASPAAAAASPPAAAASSSAAAAPAAVTEDESSTVVGSHDSEMVQ